MRLSVLLFAVAAAGVVAGAALVAVWAVGLAVIGESVCLGVFALLRDDGTPDRSNHPSTQPVAVTLDDVLDRARQAP